MSGTAVGASASASDQPEHPNPSPAGGNGAIFSEGPVVCSPRSVASMSSAGQDLIPRSTSSPGLSHTQLQQHDAAAAVTTSTSPSGPQTTPRDGSPLLSPSDSSTSLAEIRRSIRSVTSLGPSPATSPNVRPRSGDLKSPAKFLQRSHTVRASSPADFLRRSEQLLPGEALSPSPSLEQMSPRSRARSLSPPARPRGSTGLFDDGMGSWLRDKLTNVIGKMHVQLREALDEVSAIPTGPSAERNSLVVKEKIQTLVTHLLAATADPNGMSSADFQQTISALGKLLAHRCGPVCEEAIKKILLAIGHPARLLECLEFDPNAPAQEGRSATEDQAASARMTLDNSHLPRYILDKMTSSFDRSNSLTNVHSDNAETMAAHAKFLDLLADGEMPCKSDFRMAKLISSGAYGSVFIATHKVTDEQFAVKVLKKKELQQKNCVNQVMAEKEVLRFAQNPFVIQFFCSFSTQHSLYIVMEYASGGDLGALVQTMGCLTEREARRYFAETALAVEYIHEFDIIHRDLKPENLVISASGHIKLTDFGLSKIGMVTRTMRIVESGLDTTENADPEASGHLAGVRLLPVPGVGRGPPSPQPSSGQVSPARRGSDPHRGSSPALSGVSGMGQSPLGSPDIGAGDTVGTPDYMAPEVILGQDYGAAADWWSMGIILFEFVVGIPPFAGESTEEIFDNAVSLDPDWGDDDPDDPLSAEVKDLVGLLLEKRPGLRLGSAGGANGQPGQGVGTFVEDINQIKSHPFFRLRLEDNGCADPGIAWDSLLVEKACIVPTLDHDLDTSYFDDRTNRYPVRLSREGSTNSDGGDAALSPPASPLSPNRRDSLFKNFDSLHTSQGPTSPQDMLGTNLGESLRTVFADATSPLRSNLATGPLSASIGNPPLSNGSGGGGGGGSGGTETKLTATGDEDKPSSPAVVELQEKPAGRGPGGSTAAPSPSSPSRPVPVVSARLCSLSSIDEHRTLASASLTGGAGPDDSGGVLRHRSGSSASLLRPASEDAGRVENFAVHWDRVTGLGLKVHTLWLAESWQHRIKEVNPDGPAAAVGVAPNCLLLKVNGVLVAGMDRDQMNRLVAATQDSTAPVFVTLCYPKARASRMSTPATSNEGSYRFVPRPTTHRRAAKPPAKGKRRKNIARRFFSHAARQASRFFHEVARSLSPSPVARHASASSVSTSGGETDDDADPVPGAEPRSRGRPKNRTRGGRHPPATG